MLDECVRMAWSSSRNSYGEVVESWPSETTLACGVEMTGGEEKRRADGTVTVVDAVIRLPIGTALDVRDKIRVTKRHGTTLGTALTFEVIGEPMRGVSALVVECRKIG
jgi:hypothetical protein